jgi:hypothetical protein
VTRRDQARHPRPIDPVHGRRVGVLAILALALGPALIACGSSVAPGAPGSTGLAAASARPAVAASPGTLSSSSVSGSSPSATQDSGGWQRAPDIEQPAGFMTVHTDANGQPYTRGCAPCHPAIDTVMTGVTDGPAGLVAVGWVIQDFLGATWHSSDASAWTYGGSLGPTTLLTAVAANDQRYVAVGRDGGGATAWTSTDGRHWTRDRSPAFSATPLRLTAIAPWEGGFVAVGYQGSEFFSADAAFWTSPDGVSWTRVPDDADFHDARAWSVTAGGPGLVAVGQAGPADAPGPIVVWTSVDGLHWSRIGDTPDFHGARVHGVANVPSIGLVAVGDTLAGDFGVIWTSTDGRAWRRVPSGPELGRSGVQVRAYAVAAVGSGAIAVGTITEGIQYGRAIVWTSRDGATWTRAPTVVPFLDTEMNAVAAWGSKVVAVGDRGAPDAYQATAWVAPGSVVR